MYIRPRGAARPRRSATASRRRPAVVYLPDDVKYAYIYIYTYTDIYLYIYIYIYIERENKHIYIYIYIYLREPGRRAARQRGEHLVRQRASSTVGARCRAPPVPTQARLAPRAPPPTRAAGGHVTSVLEPNGRTGKDILISLGYCAVGNSHHVAVSTLFETTANTETLNDTNFGCNFVPPLPVPKVTPPKSYRLANTTSLYKFMTR